MTAKPKDLIPEKRILRTIMLVRVYLLELVRYIHLHPVKY